MVAVNRYGCVFGDNHSPLCCTGGMCSAALLQTEIKKVWSMHVQGSSKKKSGIAKFAYMEGLY